MHDHKAQIVNLLTPIGDDVLLLAVLRCWGICETSLGKKIAKYFPLFRLARPCHFLVYQLSEKMVFKILE